MHQKVLIRTDLVMAERISPVDVGVVALMHYRGRKVVLLAAEAVFVAFPQRPIREHLVGILVVRVRLLLDAAS